jgi:hypothetical protein
MLSKAEIEARLVAVCARPEGYFPSWEREKQALQTAQQLAKWLEDCHMHYTRNYAYCGNCCANDRTDRKHEKCLVSGWLDGAE